jgi:fatty-acyl-CoA synthase
MTALWPVYNGPDDVSEVESVPLAERDLPVSTYDIVTRAVSLGSLGFSVSVVVGSGSI